MKIVKKLATLLLAICLTVSCFSLVSFAADGKIQFNDPSTKVGETLEFKLVIKKDSGTLGKVQITMLYDTSYLKFVSGDGMEENTAGELVYSADLTNEAGARKEVAMKFEVLKAGQTNLTIKEATVKDASGNVKNYTKGSAKITIAEGDLPTETEPEEPKADAEESNIEIDGVYYTIMNNIPEKDIPEGYEESSLMYDDVEYKVVYSDKFGLSLAYMSNEEGVGRFFMYVELPCCQICQK